jgi:hypothetical protein
MWLRAASLVVVLASVLLTAECFAADGDTPKSSQDDASAMTARIDALLEARWQTAKAVPNPPATDAAFLRRASLDLTGAIPSVSQVRAFLADTRPDRRAQLIETLLKKPTHATRLANHWRDAMLPRNSQQVRFGQTQTFEQWLRGKFADNTAYDALVRELLTVSGNQGQVGPTLYYTSLELKPEELAASTSKIFLGVQIACAQCHNHPFDVWTQNDFWGYAAFFARMQRPQEGQQQFAFLVADILKGDVKLPDTEIVVPPRFLGAAAPVEPGKETRRQQLAGWMTSRENPYFAKAAVNRVWALLFGLGLVNPIDDFGKHNQPVDEKLLNELAADFADHGYDMRRLVRVLANTRAYGLSSEVTSEAPDDPLLFSRMSVKSLNAEQIWDCLAEATCRREFVAAANPQFQQAAFLGNQGKAAFVAKFEAPTQGATEFQAGIPQALTMMNGAVINDATDLSKSDILSALLDSPFFTNPDRVDVLFMATLTRLPTEAERTKFAAYVESGGPSNNRDKALSDVLWALLNSTEFILNH